MENKEKNAARFITGPARLGYAKLWVPEAMEEGQEKKYGAVVMIPKTDKATVKLLLAAYEAAKEQGQAKFGKKWNVDKLKNYALKDGDVDYPEKPECEGMYCISAKNAKQPEMIYRNGKAITDKDEMYSGVWAYVSLTFYGYEKGGGGIGCMLNNLMKAKDDEAFSGQTSAADDFADIIDVDAQDDKPDEDDFM